MNKYLFLLLLLVSSCDPDDMPSQESSARISIADFSIEEGNEDSAIFVRLSLNKVSTGNVTASISTYDVTAEAGSDYIGFNDVPVIIPAGSLVAEYRVDIKGDEELEADETFEVRIDNIEGATIDDGTAVITILTDEGSSSGLLIPTTGYSTPESYDGLELIWQDEFNGDQIDESFWTFEIGNGTWGWGNNELQYYRKENASIYEGHLVIEAKDEPFNGFNYTSTRMITQNKFDFQYGRVDIRASLPKGQGLWPALWMLGSNFSTVGWPACGEIDIMELLGHEITRVHGTAHWRDGSGNNASYGGHKDINSSTFHDKFHVFSIEWNANEIKWFVDDVQYHVIDITSSPLSEFREKFFFIFNVAVGGNWPGSPDATTTFPQRMIVDYIRVFQ